MKKAHKPTWNKIKLSMLLAEALNEQKPPFSDVI